MKYAVATIIFVTLVWAGPLFSAMSGGDYSIPADSISLYQAGEAVGGDYSLAGSVESASIGTSSRGDYELRGGFLNSVAGSLSYTLSKSTLSLSFGSSPLTTVASDSLIITVTTDSLTGYVTTISENGNLVSGANNINDVADGTVTAGAEEYGIKTSGGNGVLTNDTAINGTVTVASASTPVASSATTVLFRAAVSQSTISGSYSHAVTFSITANP